MNAEYVEDVPYIRHFIPELSPQRMRLAAALNGLEPPSGDDFDYCEIGCAHGDTLCALAAAHPRGRFLGIDINNAHITSAKRLAREGALDNIGFLRRDFGDLLDDDIGEFDYIVAYGVLSWISPEKRSALIDLVCAKLKPGGLFFVSYNAMPGWGAVEPLRQLLLSPVAGDEGGTLERARRGFAFARAMEQGGAEYFKKNPSASGMLETMEKAGLSYVAHEYMHEHWTPMYFARVAWEMAARDLHFAGVLPPYLNFRDTAIPATLDPTFADIKDRLLYESLRDFATNEFFRRDLYVKGAQPRSPEVTTAYLDATPWAAPAGVPETRTLELPHRAIELSDLAFEVLRQLADKGAYVEDLVQRPELASAGIDAVRDAVRRLAVAERVIPLRERPRPARVDGDAVCSVPSPYNQMMLRRSAADAPLVLASSVAGQGFPISALDALALRVLTEVPPSERAAWIEDFVARRVLRLRVGDRVIEDDAEQRRAITEAVELGRQRLGTLVDFGVLLPPPRRR